MNSEYLNKFAKDTISKHPELKNEIEELLQLCQSEIEDGGSLTHERELCYGSIKELLEEK